MKQLKLTWLWLLSALIISGGVFVGCQKDAAEVPEVTSNITSVGNSVVSLADCVPNYQIIKLFECGDLTVTATNDADNITIKILRTGEGANDHFTHVDYGFATDAELTKSVSGARKEAEFTLPIAAAQCASNLSLKLIIRGLGGLDMPSCGLVEDDGEDGAGRGKLTLEKAYTVQCPCVVTNCSMSQGYFFAKPQSVWGGEASINQEIKVVGGSVKVGGQWYTKEEGKAIFFMSCNSAGKLGFQQVATIYLSIAKGSLTGVPSVIQADITAVENFLAGKAKLTSSNACAATYASKSVQSAAGRIGNWIDANHCSE